MLNLIKKSENIKGGFSSAVDLEIITFLPVLLDKPCQVAIEYGFHKLRHSLSGEHHANDGYVYADENKKNEWRIH